MSDIPFMHMVYAKSYFTNIAVQNENKAFVYIADCNHSSFDFCFLIILPVLPQRPGLMNFDCFHHIEIKSVHHINMRGT